MVGAWRILANCRVVYVCTICGSATIADDAHRKPMGLYYFCSNQVYFAIELVETTASNNLRPGYPQQKQQQQEKCIWYTRTLGAEGSPLIRHTRGLAGLEVGSPLNGVWSPQHPQMNPLFPHPHLQLNRSSRTFSLSS